MGADRIREHSKRAHLRPGWVWCPMNEAKDVHGASGRCPAKHGQCDVKPEHGERGGHWWMGGGVGVVVKTSREQEILPGQCTGLSSS